MGMQMGQGGYASVWLVEHYAIGWVFLSYEPKISKVQSKYFKKLDCVYCRCLDAV